MGGADHRGHCDAVAADGRLLQAVRRRHAAVHGARAAALGARACDVYSLAITANEVLSRTVPYDGLTLPQLTLELHINKELPEMSLIEEGAPQALRAILEACCQFDPKDRPSADVVARDIGAVQTAMRQQT